MSRKTVVLLVTYTMSLTVSASDAPLTELEQMNARFAPVELRVDAKTLSSGDQAALPKLIGAARVLNHLFLQQVWSGNVALYNKLRQDTSRLGKARLQYFWFNKGPWSELDDHRAFLPGVPDRKPPGAGFYPEDMSGSSLNRGQDACAQRSKRGGRFFYRDSSRAGQ